MFEMWELAVYLQEDTTTFDEPRAALLARLAEAEIVAATGLAEPWAPQVKGVALEVVARAYRNPKGFSMEQAGPFMGRREAAISYAGIYLTADEMARLLAGQDAGAARSSVYTVVLRTPADLA